MCVIRIRHMKRYDIGLRKQTVQIHVFKPHFTGEALVFKCVKGDDVHLKSVFGYARDILADAAGADNAQSFALKFKSAQI